MPIELTYTEDNGIILKGRGVITGTEITEANKKIYATPELIKNIAYQIGDFTEIEGLDISSDYVRKLAEEDKRAAQINPKILMAVVGEKDLIYGLLRMWQAYVDDPPFESELFRNIKDAEDWIASKLKKGA